MRRIREVLRLRYECGLQQRLISASVGISKGSVSDYLSRAAAAGVTWAEASALDEDEIERRLFTQLGRNEPPVRVPIDFEWVHRELRRTGVTLQLLWVEEVATRQLARESVRPPVPVQPVLRSVRRLPHEGRGVDAPGASRRREGVSRLLGKEAGDRRAVDGRGDRGRALPADGLGAS